MNEIKIAFITLALLPAAVGLSSCSDDDNWKPGDPATAGNPGVYFHQDNPYTADVDVNEGRFSLSLGRAEGSSASLEVPIHIRYADPGLTIPASATFLAGETTTQIEVSMDQAEFGSKARFSLEIDKDYGDPYAALPGSTRFDGQAEIVSIIGRTTFTPGNYGGSDTPEFVPFRQNLYDNLDGTYTIKNFLYNNAGYAITFSLDENNNILPVATCGYHDDDAARWYFYSGQNSASDYYIPCYIPGANSSDWVTYIYFYTRENTTSSQAFWLDIEKKTGRMTGYSRYNVSSSGVITFDIDW